MHVMHAGHTLMPEVDANMLYVDLNLQHFLSQPGTP